MRDLRLGLRVVLLLLSGALLTWAWSGSPPELTRGPYLQNTSLSAVTIVCKLDSSSSVVLRYGRRAGPPWDFETTSASGTTHVFRLTNLRPEARYQYELSAGGTVLASGTDTFFRTASPPRSRAPFRFLAWGDSGTGSTAQMDLARRMETVMPRPHFAIGLGDLVYDSGDWQDYDPKLFEPYAEIFRRMTFWPTLGNHDVKTSSGAPYLDAFHLPTRTGAPGKPSSTEKYYSFDHGMAHFVCLDSESTSTSPGGAMYDWCEADLDFARAIGKRWLIVYMHHPPYSKGTHDSESESELEKVHDDLVPLFDAKGVDLVMVGHSHVYERSYLVHGDKILQDHPSDYSKVGSPDGSIYLVNGCGGKSGDGDLDHPLMAVSDGDVTGFNVIDVSWERLYGSFVERDGTTTDLFRVTKLDETRPPTLAGARPTSSRTVVVDFDVPLMAGSGPSGAENTDNYRIEPAVPVLDAVLDSDRRTVVLTTGELALDRAHELFVFGVADQDGNAGDRSLPFVWTGDDPLGTPLIGSGEAPHAVVEGEAHAANVPARVRFSGARSSDDQGPIAGLRWDFGDGSGSVAGSEVEHVYTSTGSYVVTLTASDEQGNEALDQLPIRIHDQGSAPVVAFAPDAAEVEVGEVVSFVSTGSHDGDGGELWRDWDFGDPASGAENHSVEDAPSHVYRQAGSYEVRLTVVDDEGSAASATTRIVVGESTPPSANFSTRPAGSGALEIAFTDRSTGDVSAWSWDFGDGETSSESSPVHRYVATGRYGVRLTVTGPAGSDAEDRTVVVGDAGGGGACSMAPLDGPGSRGDPSLGFALAAVLLVLASRHHRAAARARATARRR